MVDMRLHHAEAAITDANETHDNSVAGRGVAILAQCAGGNDCWETDGSAGGS